MNAIYLSGNSLKNKDFIEKLNIELKTLFESSKIQYYKHWETGESIIALDHEIAILADMASKITDYAVIAKSVGTIVALNALNKKLIEPKKCIFLATPVDWARKQGFAIDELLKSYDTPTLFIQNKNDPMFASIDLLALLKSSSCKNYVFEELSGDTHDYTDYISLKTLVDNFLNDNKKV